MRCGIRFEETLIIAERGAASLLLKFCVIKKIAVAEVCSDQCDEPAHLGVALIDETRIALIPFELIDYFIKLFRCRVPRGFEFIGLQRRFRGDGNKQIEKLSECGT